MKNLSLGLKSITIFILIVWTVTEINADATMQFYSHMEEHDNEGIRISEVLMEENKTKYSKWCKKIRPDSYLRFPDASGPHEIWKPDRSEDQPLLNMRAVSCMATSRRGEPLYDKRFYIIPYTKYLYELKPRNAAVISSDTWDTESLEVHARTYKESLMIKEPPCEPQGCKMQ